MPNTWKKLACSLVPLTSVRVSAPVPGLLTKRRPVAVVGLVVSVVVPPLDRVPTRWLPAHVGKEGGIRRFPFGADRNPATTIPGIPLIPLVVTAGEHVLPASVLRSNGTTLCVSVDSRPGEDFAHIAAAASGVATSQVIPEYCENMAAIAATHPLRRLGNIPRSEPQYDEASKAFTGEVYHA